MREVFKPFDCWSCYFHNSATNSSAETDDGSLDSPLTSMRVCLPCKASWQHSCQRSLLLPGETARSFCRGSHHEDIRGSIHIPSMNRLDLSSGRPAQFVQQSLEWESPPSFFLYLDSSPEQALHTLNDMNSSTLCTWNLFVERFLSPATGKGVQPVMFRTGLG